MRACQRLVNRLILEGTKEAACDIKKNQVQIVARILFILCSEFEDLKGKLFFDGKTGLETAHHLSVFFFYKKENQ